MPNARVTRKLVPVEYFACGWHPRQPASSDDVIAAIKGHAIGCARLDGTYAIR
jgi:hypothetical protein